ncbi:MAG: arginine decarboxylase, pyruvoyl-dependent [Polyangiales bacterium]
MPGLNQPIGEGLPTFQQIFVPKGVFFTHGVGVHKDYLSSFELALRDAGVEKANLVTVSSIFPAHCREVTRREALKILLPGQITHCVMARQATDEPNRLIAAAIGLARPADPEQDGSLSEHHSYGETGKKAGDYAEDLAATMLATTLGIEIDPEKAYDERKEVYKAHGHIFRTRSVVQSAEGDAKGKWTTVVALGIFIF